MMYTDAIATTPHFDQQFHGCGLLLNVWTTHSLRAILMMDVYVNGRLHTAPCW